VLVWWWSGSTVLDACKKAREYVPTLCHHPMLEPVGLCRLCLVELASAPAPELSPEAKTPLKDAKPGLRAFMNPKPVLNAPHKLITACTTEAKDGFVFCFDPLLFVWVRLI
jgi:NADH-quinone oxidoreductase subunit G